VKLLDKFGIVQLENMHHNLLKNSDLTQYWVEGLANTLMIVENTGMNSSDQKLMMEGLKVELRRICFRN